MLTSPCSGFLHERLFGLFYRGFRTGHGCEGSGNLWDFCCHGGRVSERFKDDWIVALEEIK